MSRSRIALLTLVAFVLGALAGSMAMRAYDTRILLRLGKEGPPLAEVFKSRLFRELDLDEGQRGKVGAIVEETHRDVQALLRSVRPRISERLDRSGQDIRALLNADQKRRFEQMEAERKAHEAEMDRR